MKKFIIIIIIACILIIGFLIAKDHIFVYKEASLTEVKELNYFLFKEQEKYGVIDKKGQKIIDALYDEIIIPNPEVDLFMCINGEKIEAFNSKKEKRFSNYESVEPIKLTNLANALCYEKSTLKYKKDDKYGLIDFNEKEITKNIYSQIENLKPAEGKFIVEKDGKMGIINLNGEVLVEPKYDKVLSDEYYTKQDEYKKSGFITCEKEDDGYKYGYINYKGKSILTNKFNAITRILKQDEDAYLIVSENGKQGLYKNSKKITENEYASIEYVEDLDVLIVEKNRKFGVNNLTGKNVVNMEYDEISSRGLYLYAKSQKQNNVFDKNGNKIDMNFERSIYKTENENYNISTQLNNNITYYGIVDKNGNQLVKEEYRYIEYLYDNYFTASNEEGKLGVINNNGKIILDLKYNSIQKIKGKNIIEIIDKDMCSIYSKDMKKVAEMKNLSFQTQQDYVIISNEEETIYLDNDGNIITNIENLKNTEFPNEIAEYHKKQPTLEIVYYEK